ncbi:MAG: hypothetical protein AAF206_11810 [Bacteroidota bacterium]
MSTSSVNFSPGLGIPSSPIVAKGKKDPSKNVARVNKMIIADPGIGFEIEFDKVDPAIKEKINYVKIKIQLGQQAGVYKHEQLCSLWSSNLTRYVDLSKPYLFVASFIDKNWRLEEGNYYVRVTVEFLRDLFNGEADESLEVLEMDADVTIPKNNGKFQITIDGAGPQSLETPPSNQNPGANDVRYSNGVFHELGTTFEMKYPHAVPTTEINSNRTRLWKNTSNAGSGVFLEALNSSFDLTEKGFHWLPFPNILPDNEVVSKANFHVLPAHNHNEEVGVGNLQYFTTGQTTIAPKTGPVVISVE